MLISVSDCKTTMLLLNSTFRSKSVMFFIDSINCNFSDSRRSSEMPISPKIVILMVPSKLSNVFAVLLRHLCVCLKVFFVSTSNRVLNFKLVLHFELVLEKNGLEILFDQML